MVCDFCMERVYVYLIRELKGRQLIFTVHRKLREWYVTLTGKRNECVFDLHADESVKKWHCSFAPPAHGIHTLYFSF